MLPSNKFIEKLTEKLKELNEKIPEFVECETCGCLLNKETALKGKKIIAVRQKAIDPFYIFRYTIPEDYIKQTYYCKIHKPKK